MKKMDKEIIMIVEEKPVFEGDKLIFTPNPEDFGEVIEPYIREVFIQHRSFGKNPEWVEQWSWQLKQ